MFELGTVDYPTEMTEMTGLPEGVRLRPYAGPADVPR